MKSKVFTILADDLNNNEINEVNCSIVVGNYTKRGEQIIENEVYYPLQIKITNFSESKIGFITLSNEREEEVYIQNPQWFEFIPIEKQSFANNSNTEKTSKILIKKIIGEPTVNKPVEIVCIGYRK